LYVASNVDAVDRRVDRRQLGGGRGGRLHALPELLMQRRGFYSRGGGHDRWKKKLTLSILGMEK
jgi:hypothetical protein